MDAKLKRTLIVIGTVTAVEFLTDVTMYSYGASGKGSFKFRMPVGKDLFMVIAAGIITGIILDFVINKFVESQKTAQEKALDKIIAADLAKLEAGELKTAGPVKIQWA